MHGREPIVPAARTTITIPEHLHRRLTEALSHGDAQLVPLVNQLLEEWVAAREREERQAELRQQFRRALATQLHRADQESLEDEWAEVDEEAARLDEMR